MQRFINDLQEALACVTTERLSFAKYHQSDVPHVVWLADDAATVKLRGQFQLGLAVALRYQVVPSERSDNGWKIRTTKYIYEIADERGDSLFEFHWHPDGSSRVTTPHLHIRPSLKVAVEVQDLYRKVTKSHIPTGRVALEQVVRFLIAELDIVPLRDDWEKVLQATEDRFKDWRTWD